MKKTAQVIFLNGPSSAGKSTIAHALQLKLTEPYLHIGIDKLISMMPEHLNNWEGGKVDEGFWWQSAYDEHGNILQHIQLGPYAKKISELLKDVVITMLSREFNVIIDEVCVGEHSSMSEWKTKLASYQVLYVGVNASVENLEAREKERGDRIIGSARAQWLEVHKNVTYDVEVNTDELSIDECLKLIMSKNIGHD
ncbi:MAG TPA: AAA family ATPase [Gammaproteobacteria bacterium]|nr:AAA family ATPase [Gammaproteobacteria bacterium]